MYFRDHGSIAGSFSVTARETLVVMPEPMYHIDRIPANSLRHSCFYRELRYNPILVLQPDVLSGRDAPLPGHFRIYPENILIHYIRQVGIIGSTTEGMGRIPSIIKAIEARWRFFMCFVYWYGIKTGISKFIAV